MPARHVSRKRALQVLYSADLRQQPVDASIASYYETLYSEEEEAKPEADTFMEELARGTAEQTESIDRTLTEKSENWRLERMSAVDRNILRLAVYEMLHHKTPPAIVIDEALNLARQFSGDESVSFINGILDAVHRDMPQPSA